MEGYELDQRYYDLLVKALNGLPKNEQDELVELIRKRDEAILKIVEQANFIAKQWQESQ